METVLAAVVVSALPVVAQDAAADASGEEAAAKEQAVAPAAVSTGKDHVFLPLMRLGDVSGGTVEVLSGEGGSWQKAVAGRYYPFGAEVRLTASEAGASARFELGGKADIVLTNGSVFATRPVAIGAKERTILVKAGTLALDLPRTLKDGLVTVVTPDFTCRNLAGESRFTAQENVDAREFTVRVVTGSMAVEGRHWSVKRMGAADQVRVMTSADALLTTLRGESGACEATLDCGVKQLIDPETGTFKDVPQNIAFALSPKCAVKIWRKVSETSAGGSGRMSVAVQTFDAQGNDKNYRVFFEGRANVNTGEMVAKPVALPVKDKAEAKKPATDESEAGEKADGEKADGEKADGEKAEKAEGEGEAAA